MTHLACNAILFDLDGVLVDSTACVERHWRWWARQHDISMSDILALAHGRRTLDTMRLVAPHLPLERAEREARDLDQREAADTAGIVAARGVVAVLDALPRETWAVVTSGHRALATTRLRAAGLPHPPVVICAEDVREGKPHPEGYLSAARRLDIAPADCLVIEDAPPGIAAARAAGMRVLAVATTHPPGQLHEADACVPSLAQIRLERNDHQRGPRPCLQLHLLGAV